MPPLYQILTQLGTMWPYQDSPLILILEQMTGESRNAMCAVERQSFVLRARELGYPEPCYALALAISRSPCGKTPAFYFDNMTSNTADASMEQNPNYWEPYVNGLPQCHFPKLNPSTEPSVRWDTTTIKVGDVCKAATLRGGRDLEVDHMILAAWASVLRIYVHADAVSFGYTNLLQGSRWGLLPCRLSLDASQRVSDLLEKVTLDQEAALASRSSPSTLSSDADRNSAFDTVLHIHRGDSHKNSALTEVESLIATVLPKCTIWVDLKILGSSVVVEFHYSTAVLSSTQARNCVDAFSTALSALSLNITQSLGNFSFLSGHHLDQINSWNTSQQDTRMSCVHDLIKHQALVSPQATAVDAWDGILTYAELDQASSDLAQQLLALGVRPDSLIPQCLEKSKFTPVAWMAVWKAGGAIVPMDPAYPSSRLKEIIACTESRLILASDKYAGAFRDIVENVFVVSADTVEISHQDARTIPQISATNLVYSNFTSGSTGKPKGVLMEHASFCTSARRFATASGMNESTRTFQFASYGFGISIYEVVATLISGGCVCIPRNSDRVNKFAEIVVDMRINWACLTPSLLKPLDPRDVDFKTLILVGEVMSEQDAMKWSQKTQLYSIYGQSETGIVAFKRIADNRPGSLGHANGIGWLVDENNINHLIPVGAVGELVVKGTIARGYLKDDDLTSKTFVTAPSWALGRSSHRSRVCKTGDLMRQSPDGSLTYIGRKDFMVKVRGQRVELGEVERAIAKARDIKQALVLMPTAGLGRRQLVAVLTLAAQGSSIDQSATPLSPVGENIQHSAISTLASLKEQLKRTLPTHMIPSIWLLTTKLPLTVSGKLDRQQIQKWCSQMDQTYIRDFIISDSEETTEPISPVEAQILATWSAILQLPKDMIGRSRSFLGLGGDSILAMEVISSCRRKGLGITVRDVLESRNVTELASKAVSLAGTVPRLQAGSASSYSENMIKDKLDRRYLNAGFLRMAQIEDCYPVSPMQQGILLSQSKSKNYYQCHCIFQLTHVRSQTIDLGRLSKSWQLVVMRHRCLRTAFVSSDRDDSMYDQVVLGQIEAPTSVLSNTDKENVLLRLRTRTTPSIDNVVMHHMTFAQDHTGNTFCRIDIDHALFDGLSMGLLVEDLGLAYSDISSEPLGNTFGEYIDLISKSSSSGGLQYWMSYLEGIQPCIFPLLNDGLPQAQQSNRLNSIVLEFGNTAEVFAEAKAQNVTISNMLQVAWALVLRMYTGLTDVSFGYLTSGRDAPIDNIDRAVGPFINMLTCRLNVSNEKTVGGLLEIVQNDFLKGLSAQYCSLAAVQHVLNMSGQPLFNTNMSIFRGKAAGHAAGCLLFNRVETVSPTEYAISIDIEIVNQHITGTLSHWTSHISQGQATNIVSTFQTVVERMTNDADSTVDDIILPSPRDQAQIMKWNAEYPEVVDACVHDLFHDQVLQQPQAQAICSWDGKFSYSELNAAADSLACLLVTMYGVGPESIVPLCFQKSAWAIVAMIGVLKAGGAYVSLDPSYPLARKEYIVQQVAAKVILTSVENQHLFETFNIPCVEVAKTSISAICAGASLTKASTKKALPKNPAYVVFTSGSTGVPKGIIIEHGSYCSGSRAHARLLNINSDTRYLQFAAYTFDVSIGEILTTLMHGGCVCVPSDSDRLNCLGKVMKEMEVNAISLTPTVADSILRPNEVSGLKTFVLGGEPVTTNNVRTWGAHGHEIYLINSYGPAETVVFSSFARIEDTAMDPANIGYGIGGLMWIADAERSERLVSIGAVGELLIEGPVLARGYLNNPSKTSAAFIKHPEWLGARPSDRRVYRTGDLVRYNSNGTMAFVGRRDTQIKLRGLRIELGEIEFQLEQVLRECSSVVVESVTLQNNSGRQTLVAFLQLEGYEHAAVNDMFLRISENLAGILHDADEKLARNLASYMLPTMYVPLSSVPLSTSGKTDRGKLREVASGLPLPDIFHFSLSHNSQAAMPKTELELQLQKLWSKVLDHDITLIGKHDSFFRLGGDSITAIKLSTHAYREGINVDVADIFQHPYLDDLACSIAAKPLARLATEAPEPFSLLTAEGAQQVRDKALRQYEIRSCIEDAYPCTALQEGIMALSAKERGAYVSQNIFKLSSTTSLSKLQKAWTFIVKQNPILRTRIFATTSGSIQVVTDEQVSWKGGNSLDLYLNESATQAMEYGQPLSYLAAIQDGQDNYIIWTANHAIYDGWSMELVLKDVEECYKAGDDFVSSVPPSFPKFIRHIMNQDRTEISNFWSSQLSGVKSCRFPGGVEAGSTTLANAVLEQKLSLPDFEQGDITLPTIIRATWALLVSRYTDCHEVVFGATLTGRNGSAPGLDITNLPCPTMATVPVRVFCFPDQLLWNFLKDVQTQAANMIKFEHVGLQNIKQLSADAARACEFHNLLVVQPPKAAPEDESPLWHLQRSAIAGLAFATTPLVVDLRPEQSTLHAMVQYDPNIVTEQQIRSMLWQFENMLSQILAAGPASKLLDVSMNSAHDAEQIATWNSSRNGKATIQILQQLQISCPPLLESNNLKFHIAEREETRPAPVGCAGRVLIQLPRSLTNTVLGDSERFRKLDASVVEKFLSNGSVTNGVYQSEHGGSIDDEVVYDTLRIGRYALDGSIHLISADTGLEMDSGAVDMSNLEIERFVLREFPTISKVALERIILSQSGGTQVFALFLNLGEQIEGDLPVESPILPIPQNLRPQFRELQKNISVNFSPYRMPSLFFPMRKMPFNETKAIDRAQLHKYVQDLRSEQLERYTLADRNMETIKTKMEENLSDLWAQVLSIPCTSITPDDNFFRLGGDSIKAIHLIAKSFDREISINFADIFRHGQLSEMAKVARDIHKADAEDSEVQPFSLLEDPEAKQHILDRLWSWYHISSDSVQDIYPCTPLQEGAMALSIKQPGAYVSRNVLRLSPAIDKERFRASWQTVQDRNPILRTRFVHTSKYQMSQVVLRSDAIEWKFSSSKKAYLESDAAIPAGYGAALTSYAIIDDPVNGLLFIWSLHHSIYDGWSLDQLLRQANDYYQNRTSPDPTQYAKFIRYLKATDENSLKAFWEAQLSKPAAARLSYQLSGVSEQLTTSQVMHSVEVPSHSRSEITMPILLRTAWAILLSKYSGSDNVVFGVTLSGRSAEIPGITSMSGPTMTTVPVHIELDPNKSIEELKLQIRDQATSMMRYEHYGLQKIRKINQLTEEASNFETLLIVHPSYSSSVQGQHWEREQLHTTEQASLTYSVVLDCILRGDTVDIILSYDSKMFDDFHIDRIIHQMSHILKQLTMNDTDQTVASVDVFSPEDHQQLVAWSEPMPSLLDICLHELIDQHSHSSPLSPAIRGWDHDYTYCQLDKVTTALGGHLRDHGIGPETIVPFCFEKSALAIVAMIGILKAGGACMALDPEHPKSYLETLNRRVNAGLVLASEQQSNVINESAKSVMILNHKLLEQLPLSDDKPPLHIPSSSLAFVIFTSGTTGTPKGIMLEHGALSSSTLAHGKAQGKGSHTRALQFASYTFDASIEDIFTTLVHGGCVCVPSDLDRKSNLPSAIRSLGVTLADLPPKVALMLHPQQVPSLNTLIVGGEKMPKEILNVWATSTRLINAYGPAECAMTTSIADLSASSDPSNIGRGVGCRYWVVSLEDETKLAPIGCAGELFIEGPNLARGYLKDEHLTSLSFLKKPSWLKEDLRSKYRVYRTGDIVRYSSDGSLIYMGRKDGQMKLRGQRIETSAVEYHIRACSKDIEDVVVDEVKGSASRIVLVAFLRLKNEDFDASGYKGATFHLTEERRRSLLKLQSELSGRLPRYFVPGMFVPVSSIPLNSSGKVDKATLRRLVASFSPDELAHFSLSSVSKTQPTHNMELELRRHWASILQISAESIGKDDGFFQVGGDSIDAIQLSASLLESGWSISVASIFRSTTLTQMASTLRRRPAMSEAIVRPFSLLKSNAPLDIWLDYLEAEYGIDKSNVEDIYPCTPLQEGLMALSLKQHGTYISRNMFELSANLDIPRFKSSWQKTIERNPILCTRFALLEGSNVFQVVCPESPKWYVWECMCDFEKHDGTVGMGYGSALTEFSLVKIPSGYTFIWTIHHAIYDGWSMQLILQDLKDNYRAETMVDAAPKSPRPPFSHVIKHNMDTDKLTADAFWRSYLSGGPFTQFPPLRGHVMPAVDEVLLHEARIPQQRSFDKSPSTLVRAAWAIVQAKHTDSVEAVFGATLSGRNAEIPRINEITGPTFNTVPTRVTVNPNVTVAEYLSQIHTNAVAMIPFEQIGLHHIRSLGPDCEQACDFQCLLVFQQDGHIEEERELWRQINDYNQKQPFFSYPLTVECAWKGDLLSIKASFDADVIGLAKLQRILYQFEHVLRQMTESQDTSLRLRDLQLISPQDLSQIHSWNLVEPIAEQACVHEMVMAQVGKSRDAIAVSSWDGQLTYGSLDKLSTLLAIHLHQDLGVTQETMVPLCFEKSKWMTVAMLAVLKAGGACVPINPKDPPTRIQKILKTVWKGHNLVVSSRQTSPIFSGINTPLLVVEDFMVRRAPGRNQVSWQLPEVHPSTVAFVLFTSGSTGIPKGVILEHSSLCTSMKAHGPLLGFTSSSRTLQFSAYTFDLSITDHFTTLINGGCICVPSEAERLQDLQGFIAAQKVNIAVMTPSVSTLVDPRQVPTLKNLAMAGEAVGATHMESWASTVRLSECYGPCECSIYCTHKLLPPHSDFRNLGHPLASLFWIVEPNDHDRLVPIGCVGELMIEGPLLARGYLDDEERTNAAFIESPTWATGGKAKRRFYKTGDLVSYCPDGSINFVGRKDTQIKLYGQRLELTDVEYNIKKRLPERFGSVTVECITTNKNGPHQSLVVFFDVAGQHSSDGPEASETLSNGQADITPLLLETFQETILDLVAGLREALPTFMIPSTFIPLEAMPFNTSGKVDRKRLRKFACRLTPQELERFFASADEGIKTAPASEAEVTLQKLWAQILCIEADSIGCDDNFFQHRGDSISAMKLSGLARSRGLLLTVAEIFEHPELKSMAQAMVPLSAQSSNSADFPSFALLESSLSIDQACDILEQDYKITRGAVEDIYPCSPLQEGLFSLSLKNPGSYMSIQVFELLPGIDTNLFKLCWETVHEQNPVLRTRIVDFERATSYQVVLKERIHWSSGNSLNKFVDEMQALQVALGSRLNHYALIDDGKSGTRYFVWTIHHALYDGRSLNVLAQQVKCVWESARRGTVLPRLTASLPFKSFIRYINNNDAVSRREFWKSEYDEPSWSHFPKLRKDVSRPRADASAELSQLLQMGSLYKYTLATVIQSAWSLVLRSYTDSSDVVFGLTLTGSDAPLDGIGEIVGPTFTTVPVRVKMTHDWRVEDLLKHVQEKRAKISPHEHTGLQNIMKVGDAAANACRFQNLLVIQPRSSLLADDAFPLWKPLALSNNESSFLLLPHALVLVCEPEGEGIKVTAHYDSRILSSQEVTRLLEQFYATLQNLTRAPHLPLSDISIMSQADHEDLLRFNQPIGKVDRCLVHELVEQQVALQPQAEAVCAWDGSLSYAELELKASLLAHELRILGVRPGDLIPLCFEKSKFMTIAMLGVLKAGAGCVGLDPQHPKLHNQGIVKDVGSQLLIASALHGKPFDETVNVTLVVDTLLFEKIDKSLTTEVFGSNVLGREQWREPLDTSSVAFVVSASGSTGNPKAVLQSHSNICSSATAHGPVLGIGPGSRVLNFSSHASIQDHFTTLMRGGCVCIPSEHDRLNDLASAINDLNVNWTFLTPSAVSTLQPSDVPMLKTLVLAGELVHETEVKIWADAVDLHSVYGPAESAIYCTWRGHIERSSDPTNIGCRVAGTGLWVVHPENHHQLVPIGCIGELLVESSLLALGYLNDEAETRDTFVTNVAWATHKTPSSQRRFFKTGDLVRYNLDGSLQYITRKDTQIKLHGQRIELREIEHQLQSILPSQVQSVVECVTIDALRNKRLVSFIHWMHEDKAKSGTNSGTLKDHNHVANIIRALPTRLRELLPEYMIPKIFVPVSQPPWTSTGKLDRRKLRDIGSRLTMDEVARYTFNERVKRAPSTSMERRLQSLWAKVLNVEEAQIGADDNFFSKGGDSIKAMRLSSAARKMHVDFSVALVFKYPKLCDLSQQCSSSIIKASPQLPRPDTQDVIDNLVDRLGYDVHSIAEILPASDYQAWVLSANVLRARGYQNYFIFSFPDGVSQSRLQSACHRLIVRNRILRTSFAVWAGRVWQVIEKDFSVFFKITRTSGTLEDHVSATIESDLKEEVDIRKRHVKFILIRGPQNDFSLIMRLSHAQYDGISLPLLLKDFYRLYTEEELEAPRELPSNLYAWTQDEKATRYWTSHLVGSSMTNIVSHAKPSISSITETHLEITTAPLPNAFDGITAATRVKAAWALTLSTLSNYDDVVFGFVTSGRNRDIEGIESFCHPCMNIIPVRISVPQGPSTFDQYLKGVQDQHISSMPHENYGFRRIIEQCTNWPKWTRYSTILQHQNLDELVGGVTQFGDQGPNCVVSTFLPPNDVADLWVWSFPQKDGSITFEIHYAPDVISQAFVNTALELLRRNTEILWQTKTALESYTDRTLTRPMSVHDASDDQSTPEEHTTSSFHVDQVINVGDKAAQSVPSSSPLSSGSPLASSTSTLTSTSTPSFAPLSSSPRDIVTTAWKTVLPPHFLIVNQDTPFYDIWGDLIAAAQLHQIYTDKGAKGLIVEDLIESPTMKDHIRLLGGDVLDIDE